jgi:hypothetical protein
MLYLITHKLQLISKAAWYSGRSHSHISKAEQHVFQLKPTIVPIAEFGQVTRQMFGSYGMVSTRDCIFHIAYQGVNPGKPLFGDTLWATACDNADMAAPCPYYGGKTRLPEMFGFTSIYSSPANNRRILLLCRTNKNTIITIAALTINLSPKINQA